MEAHKVGHWSVNIVQASIKKDWNIHISARKPNSTLDCVTNKPKAILPHHPHPLSHRHLQMPILVRDPNWHLHQLSYGWEYLESLLHSLIKTLAMLLKSLAKTCIVKICKPPSTSLSTTCDIYEFEMLYLGRTNGGGEGERGSGNDSSPFILFLIHHIEKQKSSQAKESLRK